MNIDDLVKEYRPLFVKEYGHDKGLNSYYTNYKTFKDKDGYNEISKLYETAIYKIIQGYKLKE